MGGQRPQRLLRPRLGRRPATCSRSPAEALRRGIAQARPGNHIGDIGHAVQTYVEAEGFSVVRQYVGHGIGRNMHEPPQVPNYGRPGTGNQLKPGYVLAIEPMVNAGGAEVRVLDDGWTVVTCDRRRSCYFEHTVAVTPDGPGGPHPAGRGGGVIGAISVPRPPTVYTRRSSPGPDSARPVSGREGPSVGRVIEPLPNALYRVELEDGHRVLAHPAGKARLQAVRILPGTG